MSLCSGSLAGLGPGGSWLARDKDNKRRKDVLDLASKSRTKGQGPAGLLFGGQAALDVPFENLSTGDSERRAVWGVSNRGLEHSVLVLVGVLTQCF